MNPLRKLTALVLFMTIMTFTMVPVQADAIWSSMKAGIDAEASGDYDTAVLHWIDLIDHYEATPAKMDPVNYAMFLEKIGDYYAGVYNANNINHSEAVAYYDRSTAAYSQLSPDFTWGVVQTQNKANALRTTIDVFIEEVASEGSVATNYEPSTGAFLGMYAEKDLSLVSSGYVDPSKLKATFGKHLPLQLLYSTYGVSRFPSGAASRMKKVDGGLQIAMEPHDLNQVAASSYLRQWARDAKASGIPVFLRFGGEMNGEWVPWGEQPELYIQKFQVVHDLMAKEAPNVVMLWSPNDVPYYNMMDYYPGDDYVDWVGISTYCVPDGNGHTDLSNYDINPMDKIQPIYDLFAGRKPIMLAESAVAYSAKNFPTDDFNDWYINNLSKYYHYVPRLFPEIKAITYFNRQEVYNDYMLSENKVAEEAYSQAIGSDYWLESMKVTSPISFTSIDDSILSRQPMTLSTYASIHDPFIGKVEYILDGELIQTSEQMPYELSYDFTNHPKDISNLLIRVYDGKGSLAATKAFTMNFPSTIPLAAPGPLNELLLQIGNPMMAINGNYQELDPGKGTTPVIIDDHTLVPIRAIVEAMGGNIEWDGIARKVTIYHGTNRMILWIDQTEVKVNNQIYTCDTAPTIINNRTLLPIRFVAEVLEAQVTWLETPKEIIINY